MPLLCGAQLVILLNMIFAHLQLILRYYHFNFIILDQFWCRERLFPPTEHGRHRPFCCNFGAVDLELLQDYVLLQALPLVLDALLSVYLPRDFRPHVYEALSFRDIVLLLDLGTFHDNAIRKGNKDLMYLLKTVLCARQNCFRFFSEGLIGSTYAYREFPASITTKFIRRE